MAEKKKKSKKAGIIAVVVIIAVITAFLGVYFGFEVHEITYVGNEHYSDEEMTQRIFGENRPNAVFYTLLGDKDKEIPFVEKYDVEVDWPHRFYITVYEKAITGYIRYMGCNMYFDREGIVVESSTEEYADVPEIIGLNYRSIVLGSQLDVGNEKVFRQILDLTQSFDKYQLGVQKVYFDASYNVVLYMGDVKVYLGNASDYTDKLFELKQMLPHFDGLKGTLYMQDYTGDTSSIIFKKDNE